MTLEHIKSHDKELILKHMTYDICISLPQIILVTMELVVTIDTNILSLYPQICIG